MSFSIREARPSDAAAVVAHIKRILAEPVSTTPLAPEELMTVEEEHDIIEDYGESSRAAMFIAEAGRELIGDLTIRAISARARIAHVATLGMSVAEGWRRRGVGRALLERAIAWCPKAGITRIELYVFARNTAAIKLYESMGFVVEGRRRSFIKEGDGYLDDLVMGKLLGSAA